MSFTHETEMILEITTPKAPGEVLAAAKEFFATRAPLYAAFLDREGPDFVTFRAQGGEELVIGVQPVDGGTLVRGSTYLYDAQISRFFTSLVPTPMAERMVS